jgi:hypothetical protein
VKDSKQTSLNSTIASVTLSLVLLQVLHESGNIVRCSQAIEYFGSFPLQIHWDHTGYELKGSMHKHDNATFTQLRKSRPKITHGTTLNLK